MTADRNPLVVYGVNANYILPALISIWSLHRRASRPVNVMLYPEASIEPHDLDLIDRVRDRLGLQLERKIFPANVYSEFEGYNELNSTFPPITLLPLVLPHLVEGRCLFLDADTLVMGDVWELLDTDMGELPLGACLGLMISERMYDTTVKVRASDLLRPVRSEQKRMKNIKRMINLGFAPREDYFNSGVLLMDCDVVRDRLPGWESLSSMEKLRPFADLPDQDRLNQFFHGHWFQLPLKWNTPTGIKRYVVMNNYSFRNASSSLRRQMKEAAATPMIWHYLGSKKPWKQYGEFPWRLTRRAFRDYFRVLAEFNEILSHSPEHSELAS